MFPNPQDALPLPLRPNLERYKKLAKELVKACKSTHRTTESRDAIHRWAEKWIKALVKQSGIEFTPRLPVAANRWIKQVAEFASQKLTRDDGLCRLAEAQFVIARAQGFESWPRFAKHVEGLTLKTSSVARFEFAADAIVRGDVATLERLLREDPKLVKARSTREHRATLLHYVAANGVEGYRQKTPKNAVWIAELLLKAGAEVDAEADVYGGGATTLGLTATSVHPFVAGVQNPLMQVLLDHGAVIDYEDSGGHHQNAALACLANGRPEAAAYLIERGGRYDLEAAAGVGRLDLVKSFFKEDGSLKAGTSKRQLQSGFLQACCWGAVEVVEYLLEKGAKLNGHSGDGQTALHWAVICGNLDIVRLLLTFSPPLEAKNMYGGTALGQTLWSAAHGGDLRVYAGIIEALIEAGAKVPERHVPVNPEFDELLKGCGSVAEPSWYWYGEGP